MYPFLYPLLFWWILELFPGLHYYGLVCRKCMLQVTFQMNFVSFYWHFDCYLLNTALICRTSFMCCGDASIHFWQFLIFSLTSCIIHCPFSSMWFGLHVFVAADSSPPGCQWSSDYHWVIPSLQHRSVVSAVSLCPQVFSYPFAFSLPTPIS